MAFILLHKENNFCAHEAKLVNIEQMVSVATLNGGRRGFKQRSHASIKLTDNTIIHTLETLEAIMGMIREANGGQKIPGSGPQMAQIK